MVSTRRRLVVALAISLAGSLTVANPVRRTGDATTDWLVVHALQADHHANHPHPPPSSPPAPPPFSPPAPPPTSSSEFRIYATGWQKSGSTIMTVALGRGLHTDYALEAVEGCCCAGHSCADVEQTARCANSTDLTAELWGGDMDAYVSDCESVFATRRVLKADDMVWQIDSLIQHARSLEHALTANLQFVFFVRHPLFNIRSLLAWCAPDGHSDADDATACAREQLRGRDRGSNNTLFLRIFAQHGTNDLFAEPVSLAATWRDGACHMGLPAWNRTDAHYANTSTRAISRGVERHRVQALNTPTAH